VTGSPSWDDFRRLRFSAGGYLVTREFSQRVGAVIAYAGWRSGCSPSALTWLGLACNILASALYAFGPPGAGATLAALALYQLAYGFDCADGQLARGSAQSSAFGAWLDLALDYVRCILVAGAVLLVLAGDGRMPLELALLPAGLLLAGMVVSAHTGMALRGVPRGAAAEPLATVPAAMVRVAIDTPTILLVLCILRGWPAGLGLYCAALGIVDCLVAGLAARRRLSGSPR
jgi:phosphatidylglycerophosphate synthase